MKIQVSPSLGINEASFMIRVKDASKLDFERVQSVNMDLIAREVVEGGRETRVPITVHILDQNDNRPQFADDTYEVWVGETLRPGQLITEMSASDLDSGMYGSKGIR